MGISLRESPRFIGDCPPATEHPEKINTEGGTERATARQRAGGGAERKTGKAARKDS